MRTRAAVAWEWALEGGQGGRLVVGRNGRGESGGALWSEGGGVGQSEWILWKEGDLSEGSRCRQWHGWLAVHILHSPAAVRGGTAPGLRSTP